MQWSSLQRTVQGEAAREGQAAARALAQRGGTGGTGGPPQGQEVWEQGTSCSPLPHPPPPATLPSAG